MNETWSLRMKLVEGQLQGMQCYKKHVLQCFTYLGRSSFRRSAIANGAAEVEAPEISTEPTLQLGGDF